MFAGTQHHPAAGAPAHPAGTQPVVPDPQRVPHADRVRERAHRGTGAGPPRAASVARRLCDGRRQRRHLVAAARGGAGRTAPPNPVPTYRMASNGCWRSLSRWPRTRGCCCWTSRWPGLAEADRQVVGKLIRQLAETHAVLLIEHDIDRVLALSDRITVLHQGRADRRRQARRGRRRPRSDHRLSRHRSHRSRRRHRPTPKRTQPPRTSRSCRSSISAPATPAARCWRIST